MYMYVVGGSGTRPVFSALLAAHDKLFVRRCGTGAGLTDGDTSYAHCACRERRHSGTRRRVVLRLHGAVLGRLAALQRDVQGRYDTAREADAEPRSVPKVGLARTDTDQVLRRRPVPSHVPAQRVGRMEQMQRAMRRRRRRRCAATATATEKRQRRRCRR